MTFDCLLIEYISGYLLKISIFNSLQSKTLYSLQIQLISVKRLLYIWYLFQRTGSTLCPQLAKASSQVSRPGVRRAACCERPSWFTYLCACHQPKLKLRHYGLHYWDVKFPKFSRVHNVSGYGIILFGNMLLCNQS